MVNMQTNNNIFGWAGFASGAIALGLALFHHFLGPFHVKPSATEVIAELATEIKESVKSKFSSKEKTISETETFNEKSKSPAWSIDKKIDVIKVSLGFIALLLAAISFMRHEKKRIAGMAAAFGSATILFMYIGWIVGVFAAVFLIGYVFSTLE